ncbi:MAG: hypothetical protein ABEJ94_07275 [Halorientalis sp.]
MTTTRERTDPERTLDRPAIVKNAASSHFSVVDLAAREVVGTIGEGRYPHTARFHPDGRLAYLLYVSSAHLEVVDLDGLETVARIEDLGTAPVGSAMTPDGDRLFVGTAAGLPDSGTPGLVAFDVGDDGIPRRSGSLELGRCAGMTIGPDGRLYTGLKEDAAIAVLSPTGDLGIQEQHAVGEKPHDLYPVPGTDLLAINNAGESYASFVDVRTGTVTNVETGENPHGIAFADAPDYRRVVFPAREDDRVAVADLDAVAAENEEATEALIDVGTTTGFAATTPDGRYAVVDSYDEEFVTILDVATLSVASRAHVGGEPLHVVFAPDGTECYVGNMARPSITVLDTEPLLAGRPDAVERVGWIEGVGEKPSGIFPMEVNS